MTAAMIVLAVLLAVVLLALGLFLFACRRSPVPDFTKPAVIAQWGREDQTEEILAGITLMQDAEDIFLPSQDGLRLHGQLLQRREGHDPSVPRLPVELDHRFFHCPSLLLFARI